MTHDINLDHSNLELIGRDQINQVDQVVFGVC